jgi:hypothetical protein
MRPRMKFRAFWGQVALFGVGAVGVYSA